MIVSCPTSGSYFTMPQHDEVCANALRVILIRSLSALETQFAKMSEPQISRHSGCLDARERTGCALMAYRVQLDFVPATPTSFKAAR